MMQGGIYYDLEANTALPPHYASITNVGKKVMAETKTQL
jgi:hypothetical protein